MKVNNIIERIKSLYSKGVSSDDARLESPLVYNKMVETRSLLLSQKDNKKQHLNEFSRQYIHKEELEPYSYYEGNCDLPIELCKDLVRTKNRIPKVLTNLNKELLNVTSVEGSIFYKQTTWKTKKYNKGAKYTSSKIQWFLKDGYIYMDKNAPRIISLNGFFEKPELVAMHNCSKNNECFNIKEFEFPIAPELISPLVQLVAQELIQIFPQMIEDKTNDTSDSLEQRSK